MDDIKDTAKLTSSNDDCVDCLFKDEAGCLASDSTPNICTATMSQLVSNDAMLSSKERSKSIQSMSSNISTDIQQTVDLKQQLSVPYYTYLDRSYSEKEIKNYVKTKHSQSQRADMQWVINTLLSEDNLMPKDSRLSNEYELTDLCDECQCSVEAEMLVNAIEKTAEERVMKICLDKINAEKPSMFSPSSLEMSNGIYTKSHVMELLNYARSNLLACCMVMVVDKQRNKRERNKIEEIKDDKQKTKENIVRSSLSLNENWMDNQEEASKDGNSKLNLIFGQIISRYFKIK